MEGGVELGGGILLLGFVSVDVSLLLLVCRGRHWKGELVFEGGLGVATVLGIGIGIFNWISNLANT